MRTLLNTNNPRQSLLEAAASIDPDEHDERASLLTATSVTGGARSSSSPASAIAPADLLLEDDNDDDWEDISLPTSSLKDRLIYWTFWTVPVLLYDALRLLLFVILLTPAFCRFAYYYVTCDRQVVSYRQDSTSRRHVMDLYGAVPQPKKNEQRKPVLVFFTGGAWVIGYKMWGAFLARVFAAMGVLVVVPDYPNYPMTTVPVMVQDAEAAIEHVLHHIENYGGDPTRVMLAGQSAGGHLVSVVLLQKALSILQTGSCTGFQPKQIAGFCCISSPSDVQAMSTNFQKHGLDVTFVQSLFGVRGNRSVRMDDYDPQRIVEQLQRILNNDSVILEEEPADMMTLRPANDTTLSRILPPMSIFHGKADQTVPYEVSERFASSLHQVGIATEYIEYDGWSHTDPILEAIFMADHRFHADLYDRLYRWTLTSNNIHSRLQPTLDDTIPECRQMCPVPLVKAARFCNPF